jgi:protocatechuate 3,4-dioxygenase beta subunit
VQVDHRRKVAQLAPDTAQSKYLAAKAETDLDGRATLSGIAPGKYWLSTVGVDAASGDRHIHWDVPTAIQVGQTSRLTLSNLNGTDVNSAAP